MSKTVALFLSYLIHPAIIPTLGTAIILLLSPIYVPRELFILALVYVLAGTYVFPLLMVFFLKKLGIISSLHMQDAQERRYPFLASVLFYYLTAQSVRNFPVSEVVGNFILAGTVMIFVLWVFLNVLKLSAHLAGTGALIGLLLFLSIYFKVELLAPLAFAFACAGFLGTARLVLKAHTPREVYLGFATGLGCILAALSLTTFR